MPTRLRRAAYAFVAFVIAIASLTLSATSAQAAGLVTVTQSYAASPGYVNSPTTLSLTFTNSTGADQSAMGFLFTLPTGLTFALGNASIDGHGCPNPQSGNYYVNSVSQAQVSNIFVAAGGTCTLSIRVVAPAVGSYVGTFTNLRNIDQPADVAFTVVDPATQPRWDVCPAEGMLFQDTSTTFNTDAGPVRPGPTSLTQINLATSQNKLWPLPSNPAVAVKVDASMNAVGFLSSPTGGYVWGWDATDQTLVRIGGDGSLVSFGNLGLTSAATPSFNSGDVSPSGIMYLSQSSLGNTAFAQIDLTGPTPVVLTSVTTRSINPGTGMADWAYNPSDGALYGVGPKPSGGTSTYYLWKTDVSTGLVTAVAPLPGIGTGNGANWGADYVAPDSNNPGASFLYAGSNTSGNIYQISLAGASSVATLYIPNGPPASANDGARCATAPLNLDFGDAPNSYSTTLASDGPRDGVWSGSGSLQIGATNTADDDGQPSAAANLDTGDDGVAPFSLGVGVQSTVPVTVTNTTSYDAVLAGWIDLNQNGTFDTSERVTAVVPAGSGTTTVNLTFPTPPANFSGKTYGRFRLQSEQDGTITNPLPTGVGAAGEVEDSASVPASIEVSKVVASRFLPTDQFTVSVTGTGVGSPNTATTTGSQASVTTGAVAATFGNTYTVSETAASGSLANYTEGYSCVDTAHGGASVAAGSGTSTSFTLPQLDSAVLCTFTNTALTPWLDWGDAPDSYGTTAANDGARDPVWTGAGVLAIGAVNNAEPDGQPSTGANLDSGDDGIAPFSIDPGQQTSVSVTVTNTTSSDAIIAGWIDVNENGTFDISERATTNIIPANSGTTVVYLTFSAAPINFVGPITYGRFRLESQVDGLTIIDSPTGLGAPGEVEDWRSVMPSLGASTVVPTRYWSTDQFAVSFSGPGIAGTPTASTSGTQTTATTGQVTGFLGEHDTISEAITSGSLLNYDTTYSCVDTAHGNGVVKTGTGVTVTLVIPLADSAVLCTFTNIAKAVPTLTVQKDFLGKFALGDEVTITASGNELGAGVSATTTGTTPGTQTSGVVGPLTVSRGFTYTITEVGTAASGADLNNYTPTMVCRNNGSTVILRGTGSTETITIPTNAGAVICLLINTPRTTVAARSSIVSRYSPTDQFTVSITGGTFTQAANSATTSGSTLGLQSNAVAGPYFAASQVSYTYKEIAAVGSLSNYITTWTCLTDPITGAASTNRGTGTTITASYGPFNNPQAVCTFTNTAKSSSIEVAKVVASRYSPSDEFTVSVSGTGLGSPTTSTTTGSATSTTTGQVTSTFGGTYSVSESAASGDLADYVSTYSCVDNAHGGAAVTSGTGTSFFVSPPQIDSIVLCTFTNTADTSAFDWGDDPSDYGTDLATDGPRDAVWTAPGTLQIGSTNTVDSDGLPAIAANRDLGDDGVAPFVISAGTASTVHVSVTNTTANDAVLAGWVDLDQDGLFSTPERVTATVPAGSGTSVVDLVFPAAPVGYSGLTYGRFRLQSEQGGTITDPQPTGLGAPGEVEDWRSVPPSIEVAKVIASRVSASDQFTVSLSGTGLGGSYTASTAGIESTISTGPEAVTFGGVYSISETAASGDLANYDALYSCVDTAHGDASVASGSGTSAFLSLPQVDSIVVCTFTNTANANVLDWGDAPDTYGTTLASDGARDALWTGAGSLMIGSTNTPDADGQPSTNANLDAGDDGVAPFSIDPGQRTSVAVTVTNTTSSDASIAGWIDLDQNGTFDIPERSYTNAILAGSGTQVVYLTFPAASPTFSGLAYLRVRLESEVDGPISSLDNPTGLGPAGEVEDWQSVLPSIAASTAVTTRHASSDQFTVSVTGPGVASPFSATTTGTQASASTSQATAYLGEAYDVSETAASGDLADYVSSYDCVDNAHGSVSVASGSGTSVSVTIPQADSAVVCTFTNAAVPPSSLTVHASVSGRYNPSDQFTISDSVSSVTTTGSSNGVQAALVGPATVPGASIFAISEVAAGGTDLARYLVSYSCTNNGGSVIASGNGASATVTIPPGEGNAVVCTFSNTARPSISVQKNIASRYLPSDQFKISTTGSALRFATTSGSSLGLQTGSVLSAVSVNAGQAYTAKEVAASGSLADYSSTWTCVDTQATPTAPTISGTGATTSSFIFASGTAPHYVCTFTNTALPSVEVAKVVASRSTPTDQFTVSIVGTGIVSPATATTSGTQTAATTGKVIATYGGTYSVTESAASGDLANYDASFSCVDNNYGGASVAAGTGASVFISLPHVDSSVLCTFTNTAKAPPPTPSTPEVNLSTTADRSSLLPSGTVVYTVVGASVGLAAADGSVIDDPIASGLASYSWTCSSTAGAVCPAPAGTGALHETVATFPANSTVSYTVTARITATPGPSITNRATISPPTGNCGAPGHLVPPCVATVTTPIAAQVSVHKTADVAIFAARGHVVFTMLVSNAGVVPADGTEISDPMVTGFTGYSWTCTAIGTVCPNATGAGALDETIATFPAGSSLTYRLVATVSSAPPALISSTATVSLPAGGMCSPADQPGPCTTTITLLGPSLAATGVLIGGWLLAALASLFAGAVALMVSAGARRPSTAGRGRRRTRS